MVVRKVGFTTVVVAVSPGKILGIPTKIQALLLVKLFVKPSTLSRTALVRQSLVGSLLGSGVQDAPSNNISTNHFTILQGTVQFL